MSTAGTVGEIGGGIAGGLAGGAVGGAILGPPGAIIGRWLGSRAGRWAGRAAGEALAQAMENANTDAETETGDQAATETCVDCEVKCFEPPAGSSPEEIEEMRRQLKEQQDAINNMDPDKLLQNMDNFAARGRPPGEASARATYRRQWINDRAAELSRGGMGRDAARSQATTEAGGLNPTHVPDFVVGGDGTISGMANADINQSIGRQWQGGRARQVRNAAQHAKDNGKKTDVTLEVCGDNGGGGANGGQSGSTPSGGSPGSGSGAGNTPTS